MIESVVLIGSALSLTSVVNLNVTSIALTAGDWDVSGVVGFQGNVATVVQELRGWTHSVSATDPGFTGQKAVHVYSTAGAAIFAQDPCAITIPTYRYLLSGNTTIYLQALAAFTTNTATAFGYIRARRMR